ncbi:MAG TPA: glycoside hydrolase family 6 protein [Candidatus Dormibacteraeota bacterium]|nr:glycoside hydrolase family 6 protein [Candidatus Dormibacteraeota bacterium]
MLGRLIRRVVWCAALAALALGTTATGASAAAPAHATDKETRFFVPQPNAGALQQVRQLLQQHDRTGAEALLRMITTPQAVWFTGGTPDQARDDVRRTLREAAIERATPVLVVYNVPGRDCASFSAGGALDLPSYLAWVDAFAGGIGSSRAVVILEPDSLGLLPSSCGGPRPGYPFTDADRLTELNSAVDRLEQQPNVSVYLDGTHSAWLSVGDAASRLVRGGVQRAQGFYVNVSNYQLSVNLVQYATWISDCIAFANDPEEGGWRLGHYDWCNSQYFPVVLSPFSPWGDSANAANAWFAANMGTSVATTHFVIDTSRNGRGPNSMAAFGAAPFNQSPSTLATLQAGNWCNPPGAGNGIRPTADTGSPLLDAYVWVKIPGESDGQCDAAGGPRAWDYSVYTQPSWPTDPAQQALFDPLWGMFDPAAGAWFPQQALQLATLSTPS